MCIEVLLCLSFVFRVQIDSSFELVTNGQRHIPYLVTVSYWCLEACQEDSLRKREDFSQHSGTEKNVEKEKNFFFVYHTCTQAICYIDYILN